MHQGRIYIRAPYVLGTQPLRFTDPVIREQKDYLMLEAASLLEFTFNFLHPLPSLSFLSAWTTFLFIGSKTFPIPIPRDNEIGEETFSLRLLSFLFSPFFFLFPFLPPPPPFQKRNDSENEAIRKHGS